MEIKKYDSDQDLLALLREGDESAFAAIYKKYTPELFRFAARNIHSREDREEIIQDVFESLWQRRTELDHVVSLNAYLFRAVKYKMIRYFNHKTVKEKYAEHFKLFEAVYDNLNETERESSLLNEVIERGLAKLPDRCQAAIKMRLEESLSNEDIAKRMQIKKSTVENYMVAAVNHLRTECQTLYRSLKSSA